jgi:hypothetical protein
VIFGKRKSKMSKAYAHFANHKRRTRGRGRKCRVPMR